MLHRFSRLLAAATLVLVIAGGLVTSTGSGLAVPDWPTSYGWSMFTFPLSNMVGGIFYEHGHRLIASTVGMLTIVLMTWLWWGEPRRWVKRLGALALAAVIVQGLLGGLTVLFFLPAPISIAHAALAQLFFCLTVTIALVTSPGWIAGYAKERREPPSREALRRLKAGGERQEARARSEPVIDVTLQRIAVITTVLVFIQILLGATMRHTGAGLAIPDVPLAFGRIIPPLDRLANSSVAIHFAHRLWALVVLAAIAATSAHVWAHHRTRRELTRPATLVLALVLVQILLGGLTVWSGRAVGINTAHVATGALLLVTCLVLTLRVYRTVGGKEIRGERREARGGREEIRGESVPQPIAARRLGAVEGSRR